MDKKRKLEELKKEEQKLKESIQKNGLEIEQLENKLEKRKDNLRRIKKKKEIILRMLGDTTNYEDSLTEYLKNTEEISLNTDNYFYMAVSTEYKSSEKGKVRQSFHSQQGHGIIYYLTKKEFEYCYLENLNRVRENSKNMHKDDKYLYELYEKYYLEDRIPVLLDKYSLYEIGKLLEKSELHRLHTRTISLYQVEKTENVEVYNVPKNNSRYLKDYLVSNKLNNYIN